jgi:hypothetical protein
VVNGSSRSVPSRPIWRRRCTGGGSARAWPIGLLPCITRWAACSRRMDIRRSTRCLLATTRDRRRGRDCETVEDRGSPAAVEGEEGDAEGVRWGSRRLTLAPRKSWRAPVPPTWSRLRSTSETSGIAPRRLRLPGGLLGTEKE